MDDNTVEKLEESLDGYNGNYDMLDCDNKDGLILKEKRKEKLKLIESL